MSARTVDELRKVFQQLVHEGAEIGYLDFHAHGYAATVDVGGEDLNYGDLKEFRNRGFEHIIRRNAISASCRATSPR